MRARNSDPEFRSRAQYACQRRHGFKPVACAINIHRTVRPFAMRRATMLSKKDMGPHQQSHTVPKYLQQQIFPHLGPENYSQPYSLFKGDISHWSGQAPKSCAKLVSDSKPFRILRLSGLGFPKIPNSAALLRMISIANSFFLGIAFWMRSTSSKENFF